MRPSNGTIVGAEPPGWGWRCAGGLPFGPAIDGPKIFLSLLYPSWCKNESTPFFHCFHSQDQRQHQLAHHRPSASSTLLALIPVRLFLLHDVSLVLTDGLSWSTRFSDHQGSATSFLKSPTSFGGIPWYTANRRTTDALGRRKPGSTVNNQLKASNLKGATIGHCWTRNRLPADLDAITDGEALHARFSAVLGISFSSPAVRDSSFSCGTGVTN